MNGFAMRHSNTYLRQHIKLAVFFCATLCLVTAAVLVSYVVQHESSVEAETSDATTAEPLRRTELVVPAIRIEANTRLERSMFSTKQFALDYAPMGLVTEEELPLIIGKYASKLLAPNTPFGHQEISPHAPLSEIPIPPGFRAVTIAADARSLVDGFVRPRERVDVLWHYTNPKQQEKVKTLVPFTKVLAVNGSTDPMPTIQAQTKNTVTLLTSAEDASKIELAQNSGRLTLALLGQGSVSEEKATEVTLPSLYDDSDMPRKKRNGRFITTSPTSGALLEWQLVDNEWLRTEIEK